MAKLLSILLQRGDTNVPWGIRLSGGHETSQPITILAVTPGAMAAQYLSAGDLLLVIQGNKTDTMLLAEAEDFVREPGKCLDLLVEKVSSSKSVPATPTTPKHFSYPGTPNSPNTFNYSGTPKSPNNYSYPGRPKSPNNYSYPGTPKSPNNYSYPGTPKSPNNYSYPGTPKSPNNYSYPGTPKSPNNYSYPGRPKTPNNYTYSGTPKSPNNLTYPSTPKSPSFHTNSRNTSERPHSPGIVKTNNSSISPKVLEKTSKTLNGSPTPKTSNGTSTKKTINTPNIWDYQIKQSGSSRASSVSSGYNGTSSDTDDTLWYTSVTNNTNGQVILDERNQYMTEIRKTVNNNRKAFLQKAQCGLSDDKDECSSLESYDDVNDQVREKRTFRYSTPDEVGDRRSDGWYGLASQIEFRRPVSLPASPLPPPLNASDEEQQQFGRQSSQISGGGTTSPGSGAPIGDGVTAPLFPAPPAPPPPPPPGPGSLPTVRINTEIPESRGQQRGSTYEPPAAIQNAMMTKDKKPFTYTPGGLDLSQIRSPRMQRRITRNAAAEGVGEQPAAPKQSSLAQQTPATLPPSALAAMQPQLPVAVFPQGQVPQLHHVNAAPGFHSPPPPPPPPASPPSQPAPPPQPTMVNKSPTPRPAPMSPVAKVEPAVLPPQPQNEPGSIYVPPVTSRAQLGSLYIPPINNTAQPEVTPSPPRQTPQTPMSPIHGGLNKAPTPWMNQRPQQPAVPVWASREESQSGGARIIPIQVEGRDPPKPSTPTSPPSQSTVQSQQQSAQSANTRIIPIQIESAQPKQQQQQQQAPPPPQQQQQQQRRPVYVHNKFNPQPPPTPTSPAPYVQQTHSPNENVAQQNPRQLQQQHSWGSAGPNAAPIQSRSFRVLQKITDTDCADEQAEQPQPQQYGNQWAPQQQSTQGVPVQELRKLQLSDDDRALMDKFKSQVDVDSFLHTESDPRYRGASIPSRAFRMLQTMTDGAGGDYGEQYQVPRGPGPVRGPQARPPSVTQPATDSPPQPYIPPSEQHVLEPRKYTGGCIPSRSFRMLQAMTASPENCGPGQSDM